jgi:hypothetical protein
MPRLIPFRLAAACVPAFVLALSFAAVAAAKGVPASLRVVDSGGRVLAEKTLRAGTATVPTSPRATCFGAGTGGSGKPAKIGGSTALGLLGQAARTTRSLRPLLITDAFDFGLGLCGIGGRVAKGKAFWYLKVNHENPELGGELVKLHGGDEVLWYLSPDYEVSPLELALNAPDRIRAGKPFEVRVFSYDDRGKRRPAAGVKVTGGKGRTGADGRAMVVLKKPARLIARHGRDIPSNREAVCIGGKCPRG